MFSKRRSIPKQIILPSLDHHVLQRFSERLDRQEQKLTDVVSNLRDTVDRLTTVVKMHTQEGTVEKRP